MVINVKNVLILVLSIIMHKLSLCTTGEMLTIQQKVRAIYLESSNGSVCTIQWTGALWYKNIIKKTLCLPVSINNTEPWVCFHFVSRSANAFRSLVSLTFSHVEKEWTCHPLQSPSTLLRGKESKNVKWVQSMAVHLENFPILTGPWKHLDSSRTPPTER